MGYIYWYVDKLQFKIKRKDKAMEVNMKKLIYLLVTVLVISSLTACGDKSTTDSTTDTTELSPEEKFTDGDFTAYGENGVAFVSLGMLKTDAEKRLEEFKENVGEFNLSYIDRVVTSSDSNATTETVVNYIDYVGPRVPVYTSKGIHSTGRAGDNSQSSTDADVIAAYGIDTANESYITDEKDDKNYCISLYYNGDERVITPKGTELLGIAAEKYIRFLIVDGYVSGIEFYQISW